VTRRYTSHSKRLDVADRHIAFIDGDKYSSNLPVPPSSENGYLGWRAAGHDAGRRP